MSVSDVFQRIKSALEAAGIPYMLSGSFASAYYGSPRATQDIDLVIAPTAQQLKALVGALSTEEYYAELDAAIESLRHESLFNVIDQSTGWKIDLIICKSRPFSREEFRRRRLIQLQGLSIFAASAEDVVISKLEWAHLAQSKRHVEDVSGILRARWNLLDHPYLGKWIDELGLAEEWREAQVAAGFLI